MTQYFQGAGRARTGTAAARTTFTPTQSPFADAAARDTWAAANLDSLFNNSTQYTLIEITGVGSQQWSGTDTPSAYDNSGWVSTSGAALTAAMVKTLYESNSNTNALVDSKLSILNSLTESNNRLISDNSVEVPPGTIYIGNGLGVSGALRALHARNAVTGNRALVLAQLYDETNGFTRAFAYSGSGEGEVTVGSGGTAASNTAQFTMTTTADELITAFEVETSTPNVTQMFEFTLRTDSHSGTIAVSFEGMITTDANGMGMLRLSNTDDLTPILVDNATTLYIEASFANMVGTQVNPTTFLPNSSIQRIVVTRPQLAFSSELPTATSELTNDSNFITGITVEDEGSPLSTLAGTLNFTGAGVTASGTGAEKTITISGGLAGITVQDEGTALTTAATTLNFVGANVTATGTGAVKTITITGGATPPQAQHTNYIDVTANSNASSVDVANAVSSDDLNPTVTLETFTGNMYLQILQSQAHTRFTSIVISGINQIGGFTINDNARTISGQPYRQYVTTNLITDALSGVTITMGGAT